jgi:hypothetical protein
MRKVLLCVVILMAMLLVLPESVLAKTDHATKVLSYDGTQSCARCHKKSVQEIAAGGHYQMLGIPPYIEGWEKGKPAGMMDTY